MRRNLALLVALLAAMALGRVLTDHVPLGTVSVAPFVRTASVGHTLSLRYADLRVTGVRSAGFLDNGLGAVAPGGRFLVVDATVRAKRMPQTLKYVSLLGGDGRIYASTARGGCTAETYTAPTDIAYHVMYCFDVPRSALRGSRVEISLGDPRSLGGQARDDVARVDLGVDGSAARRLWATTTGVEGFGGGFGQPDKRARTLQRGSS